MPQNGINHPGITALAQAFAINPLLRVINLNDNTFTEKGAMAMAKVRRVQQGQVGPWWQGPTVAFARNPSAGSHSVPLPAHQVCTAGSSHVNMPRIGRVSGASLCPSQAALSVHPAFLLSCSR